MDGEKSWEDACTWAPEMIRLITTRTAGADVISFFFFLFLIILYPGISIAIDVDIYGLIDFQMETFPSQWTDAETEVPSTSTGGPI